MSDTKTITFEGREYTAPVWVEWVARDEDGSICGYETEPVMHEDAFNNDDHRMFVFLLDPLVKDWRDSLTKV